MLPSTDECDDTEEDGVDAEKMDSLSSFEILGYNSRVKSDITMLLCVLLSNFFD